MSWRSGIPTLAENYFTMKIRLLSLFVLLMFSLVCCRDPDNDLPLVDYTEFTALIKDHAIKEIYKVSNENNTLEIVLRHAKRESPSVLALKAKYNGWKGATPGNRPHLKLNTPWTEEIGIRITQTQIENGYSDFIPIKEIKKNGVFN